jgi:hypothetical protein
MMVNSLNKYTNLEYGYRPSVLPEKSYQDFISTPADQFANNAAPQKHSEFKKPYLNSTSYQAMDFGYDLPINGFTWPRWVKPLAPTEPISTGSIGCSGVTIGYTTQQMQVNESQTLTVVDAISGVDYSWVIGSGGGSLSTDEGEETVYTAPATNAGCTSNPVITLLVRQEECDTLQIAINALIGQGQAAVRIYENPSCTGPNESGYTQCRLDAHEYVCEGTYYALCTTGDGSVLGDCAACYAGGIQQFCNTGNNKTINQLLALNPVDFRSASDITAGCCPEQLL